MEILTQSFKDIVVGAEKEMSFELDSDSPIIFEVLRDKMYSNKIAAVCREVSSNSRDANREAGRADKPIQIQIIEPNSLTHISDMCIIFHDNGIGITPDRMSDIFLKYGASTKRSSNSQTGGFGLGAKTPFAYTDTFSVTTVCDWEGKRMKFTYSAMIDASRKGKMVLFESEECDLMTGTQIIIPINESDRDEFESECYHATDLWENVEYINFNKEISVRNILHKEDDFFILSQKGSPAAYRLLIDGIPYSVDADQLDISYDEGLGGDAVIVLPFETGELTIAANREALQYDKHTCEVILKRLETIKLSIAKFLKDKFLNAPSYIEACYMARLMHNADLNIREDCPYDNMIKSAFKNSRYSYGVLRGVEKTKLKDMKWKKRPLISKINLDNHNVYLVKWSGEKWIYERYGIRNINTNWINLPKYYMDSRKDGRRNESLRLKGISKFLLIEPKKDDQVLARVIECDNMINNIELKIDMYSSLERVKTQRSSTTYVKMPTVDVKVKKLNGNYFKSRTLSFDRENKTINRPQTYAVLVVDSISRYNSNDDISREEWAKITMIRMFESKRFIIISKLKYDRYLSNCETVDQVFSRVMLRHRSKIEQWIRINTIKKFIECNYEWISSFFPKLLPQSGKDAFRKITKNNIPKSIKSLDCNWKNLGMNLAFDSEGMQAKIVKNLSKYPMLESFVTDKVTTRWTKGRYIYKLDKEYIKICKDYISQCDNS